MTPAPSMDPGPTAPPSAVERARIDSVRRPYTEADIRFMTHMIPHHAQAIDMSRMAPTHGASESIQVLAARIINAQQDEIRTMQTWLGNRDLPVPPAVAGPVKMEMDGHVHEMLMPGMLTPEQMAELDAARGPVFDELYLKYMIAHHQGATAMVRDLFNTDGAGQDETVFKFASDVNVDQTTEIHRMQEMLTTLILERGLP